MGRWKALPQGGTAGNGGKGGEGGGQKLSWVGVVAEVVVDRLLWMEEVCMPGCVCVCVCVCVCLCVFVCVRACVCTLPTPTGRTDLPGT